MFYRAFACVVLSTSFSSSLSFADKKHGDVSKGVSKYEHLIEPHFMENDQDLRTPSPSMSAQPSIRPTHLPSAIPTLMPSSSPTKKITKIELDPMAITLTIQNMTAEEVNQHLENEKPRDAILFTVSEHLNWFASNDLMLDYKDSTKQDLKILFRQFSMSISEMSATSKRRLRVRDDQVEVETTFTCTAELSGIDEDNSNENTLKKYTKILSHYQTQSFKGQPGLIFLNLLLARNDTLLDQATAVESKIISKFKGGKIVDNGVSTSTDEDNLFDKWFGGNRWKRSLIYGGIGLCGLMAMATLLYVQIARKKKIFEKYMNEDDETIPSQEFPLKEVNSNTKKYGRENNPSASRNSQTGHSYPSDDTAVSSMWDTTTQKDDCKYFEYVERMNPTPVANSSRGKRSRNPNNMHDSGVQRNGNVSSMMITEEGENEFVTEESTESGFGIERNELSHSTPRNEMNETDYESVELNHHDTTHDATTVRGSNSSPLSRENKEKLGSSARQQGRTEDRSFLQEFQHNGKKFFNIWG